MISKKVICFAPRHNVKRADATGAFQPEAKNFIKHHGADPLSIVLFDNHATKPAMRKQVLDALAKHNDLDGVFFFNHGYKRGMQPGFDLQHVDGLAKAVVRATKNGNRYDGAHPIICLYACDAARDLDKDRRDDLEAFGGDGGFADSLRDALCVAGEIWCRVLAHTTAGHASKNPNLRVFEGDGNPYGGVGGHYIIPMGSRLWGKWRTALKGNFRYELPFLTAAETVEYLEKP